MRTTFKAATLCLAAGLASAQTVNLTVNTGTVLHPVDPKIYGQFLEHIYHSVNGGIWGDVVWNRSFEETLTDGAWTVNGEVLQATAGAAESRFRFGSEAWRDYELTLDMMRPAGNGVLERRCAQQSHRKLRTLDGRSRRLRPGATATIRDAAAGDYRPAERGGNIGKRALVQRAN